jgi:hypothetical protein
VVDAAHQVAVEQHRGVPRIEQAVHAVGFDGFELYRITVQVEAAGILARAEDVRRLAPERSVLRHERVRPIDVEHRRDDDDLVLEQVLPRAHRQVARHHVQRLGGL